MVTASELIEELQAMGSIEAEVVETIVAPPQFTVSGTMCPTVPSFSVSACGAVVLHESHSHARYIARAHIRALLVCAYLFLHLSSYCKSVAQIRHTREVECVAEHFPSDSALGRISLAPS